MSMNVGELFATLEIDSSQFEQELDAAGGQFDAFKGAMIAGLAAIAGSFVVGSIIAGVEEISDSFNKLEASTNLSGKALDDAKASIESIYANNFGESIADIGDSMIYAAQSTGLTGKALEQVTTEALMLRDTFGYEVPESIKVAEKMVQQFGGSHSDAMNLIAQATKEGLNIDDDLIDTLNEYSVYFSTLGYDAEEMFNFLNNGAKAGVINLDKAADLAKEFGIRIKDGSKATNEAMTSMSKDTQQMYKDYQKTGEGGKELFEAIIKDLGKIPGEADRTAAGVALMGTQFEDLEWAAVQSLVNTESKISLTKNALEDINNVRYDSVGSAITGLWRIIQSNLLFPLEKAAVPAMSAFVNGISNGLKGLKQLFEGDTLGFIETFTASFGGEKAQPAINFFIGIKNAAEQFMAFLPQVQAFVQPLLDSLSAYFNFALSGIKSFWDQNGQGILDSVMLYLGLVWSWVQPLLTDLVAFISSILDQIVAFWRENGQQIWDAVSNVFNGIMAVIQFIMPAVLFIIDMVWNSIKGVVQGALNVIMGAIKIFAGIFTGDWGKVWEGVKQILWGAVEFIWNYINLLFVGRILSAVKNLAVGFINWIKNLASGASGSFTGMISFVQNALTSFWTGILKGVGNMVSGFLNFVKNMYQGASTTFTTLKNFGSSTFQALFGAIKAVAQNILQAVSNAFNGAKTAAVNAFNNLKSSVVSAAQNVMSKIVEMKNSVLNSLSGLGSQAIQFGKDLVNGLITGIQDMAGKAIRKAQELAESVAGAVKGFFGINSPSKLFRGYGLGLGEGLIVGMDGMTGDLAKAAVKMSEAAVPEFSMPTVQGAMPAYSASGMAIPSGSLAAEQRGSVIVNFTGNLNFRNRADVDYLQEKFAEVAETAMYFTGNRRAVTR